MRLLTLAFLISTTVVAGAADLGRTHGTGRVDGAGYCPSAGGSRIATLASLEAMRRETDTLYAQALSAFTDPRVQATIRHGWADLARITCGIASGHLQMNDVSIDRLNACECNYLRMKRF